MTDVKAGIHQLFLREEELRQGMEMLFNAYREFTAEADEVLARLGFGRAHHRVIYFVGRHPGISVTELLTILRITKQSLSRVLGELVQEGYIIQTTGISDRRRRLLNLTDKGVHLERQLSEPQRQRVASAYRRAGVEAVEGFRTVMLGLMNDEDRLKFMVTKDRTGGRPGLLPERGRGDER